MRSHAERGNEGDGGCVSRRVLVLAQQLTQPVRHAIRTVALTSVNSDNFTLLPKGYIGLQRQRYDGANAIDATS